MNGFGVNAHRRTDGAELDDRGDVRRLTADENAHLVEVLPAKGFEEEHILGAINIPLKELDERASRELERERPVIVYRNGYQ